MYKRLLLVVGFVLALMAGLALNPSAARADEPADEVIEELALEDLLAADDIVYGRSPLPRPPPAPPDGFLD
jgi:hypothetical protein